MSLSTEPTLFRIEEADLAPFKAEDAFAMTLTAQAEKVLVGVDLLENFKLYETKGPGWTLRIRDEIVGCAGLMFPWPSGSLAIAWLLASPHLPRYPLTAVKLLLNGLRLLIGERQPRRIEFFVDATFKVGQRFAEFLDFRRDGCCNPPCEVCGLVRAYGPNGEDYIRYVWMRP